MNDLPKYVTKDLEILCNAEFKENKYVYTWRKIYWNFENSKKRWTIYRKIKWKSRLNKNIYRCFKVNYVLKYKTWKN